MEDYIFIILAIALSIVGAVRKNKKAKNANKSQQTKDPDFIKNYFENLELVEEEPTSISKEEPKVEKKKSTKPFLMNELKDSRIKKSPDLISKVEKVTDEITTQQTQKKKLRVIKNFSLKEAVVYSEIINRKY